MGHPRPPTAQVSVGILKVSNSAAIVKQVVRACNRKFTPPKRLGHRQETKKIPPSKNELKTG
jgi:hypothetical protein